MVGRKNALKINKVREYKKGGGNYIFPLFFSLRKGSYIGKITLLLLP
jgi:hypothetical protein